MKVGGIPRTQWDPALFDTDPDPFPGSVRELSHDGNNLREPIVEKELETQ